MKHSPAEFLDFMHSMESKAIPENATILVSLVDPVTGGGWPVGYSYFT